ncbi:hypothetical protein DD237_001074 [Peronospora effusa]|uniref:PH domain-containing protein n=1 Tax=Peronospora effusa TaxID=542832 RepID=A0A3R7W784_9STRA|nr:hypothetical protein DD237_001074 [Peronospora effusa]
MNAQPPMFSGTLQVQACHVFWTKTPVQLTYHRQDYRHELPVLLIRRPSILGGESRIPLDPCIHPVRLLSTTTRMASKLEFALEYGWHTKQVRLRAPDARSYRRWISLVSAALESGRRPLGACTAAERPPQDHECSSLASTTNSSNNGVSRFHSSLQKQDPEGEEEESHLDHDVSHQWQHPREFFMLRHTSKARDLLLVSPSNAVIGNCSSNDQQQRDIHSYQMDRCLSLSHNFCLESIAFLHQ